MVEDVKVNDNSAPVVGSVGDNMSVVSSKKRRSQSVGSASWNSVASIGASRSVCGMNWLKWWCENESFKLEESERQFRFGAGPLIQSSGKLCYLST